MNIRLCVLTLCLLVANSSSAQGIKSAEAPSAGSKYQRQFYHNPTPNYNPTVVDPKYMEPIDIPDSGYDTNYSEPRYDSDYTDTGACAHMRSLADTTYNSWQQLGGGTTGQAGLLYQAYQLYMRTYNATCSF